MKWNTLRAFEHLDDLRRQHDLIVVWTEAKPHAHPEHRKVHVPTPTDATRYLDCLHEMGHCVSPRARDFYYRYDRRRPFWTALAYDDCMLMEAAAWAWASRNVADDLLPDIPLRAWKIAGGALIGYLPYVHDEKHTCVRREAR